MNDPQRLLDGSGTALEQTLLRELRSYRGPRSMRAHTLAALGVTGSAGLATGGAMAWWSGKTLGAKLLVTVSVASVLVGVPGGYFILRPGATFVAQPAPPAVTAVAPLQPMPAPAPAIAPAVLDPPASAASPWVARASRRGQAHSADLRAELESLDAVRTTLAGGDFLRGLSLLEGYFQNFHHGRLHLEAEILRIDALARSGQTDSARSQAREFLRRYPKSVHAARLQSIAGQ